MKLRNKKTGEIVIIGKELGDDFDGVGLMLWVDHVEGSELDDYKIYGSIDELNEEWEDYKPAEPLIKDEQIRKAVRAWAWANNIDEIDHWQGQLTGRKAGCSRGRAKIQFNRALGFNYGCGFTITELCGEEKE